MTPSSILSSEWYVSGVQLKAQWIDGIGCAITQTNNKILATIFIYSMCFDLVVLLLNTYKLLKLNAHTSASEMFGRSRLTHMMWSDGLVYFLVACVLFPLFLGVVWLIFSPQFLGQPYCHCLHDFESESNHERYIQRTCCDCFNGSLCFLPRKRLWSSNVKLYLDCGLSNCSPPR